jgi:hypothetical protein
MSEQKDSLRWEGGSLFPTADRGPMEELVAAGTPVVRLPKAREDCCASCQAIGFDMNYARNGQASLRALDGWQLGDGVAAWAGYTFDALDVVGPHGGFLTYAQLEPQIDEAGIIGQFRTPGFGRSVLVAVEGSGRSFGGVTLRSFGECVVLPGSGMVPIQRVAGDRFEWIQEPAISIGRGPSAQIGRALHQLGSGPYGRMWSSSLEGFVPPDDSFDYLEMLGESITRSTQGLVLERLDVAAREAARRFADDPRMLDFTANYLLWLGVSSDAGRFINVATCLAAVTQGMNRTPAGVLTSAP